MAMRNLEVIVTVTDNASKKLDDVSRKVRSTGDSAKKASVDFTGFNRTLFATTAFVGTFLKAFSSLNNVMDEGSGLDRLSNQFERVLGPKGNLFLNISQLTDASIDKFEAMREGISLRSLGIVRSTEHLAQIMAKSGVAAKMAGKDSGEGIKNFSEFLKDGNVSHLQFLNLISSSNPALKAQMAILQKAGGVMGGVVSTQARLAMGMRLLDAATKGNLRGFRDLRDTMLDARQHFSLFRQETGRLILTALQPLIEKVSLFFLKSSMMIDNIRKNEKHIVFLTKAVILGTGAILGLAGALGTLRLASIALASVGLGLPRLLFLITGLSSAFLGLTQKSDKLIDRLRTFGAFIKGIYQLVTTLDTKTGIAQIDEDIKKLLEENGIFVFAQNIARAVSVVKTVIKDMSDAFRSLARTIDSIFGGIFRSFVGMISKFKDPWENFWVSETATPMQKFLRSFTVIGSTLGTVITAMLFKEVLGRTGSLLSKIPVIGGLFGGGRNGGPKGTKSDPMYTRDSDKLGGVGLLSKFSPTSILDSAINMLKKQILNIVAAFQITSQAIGPLRAVFTILGDIVASAISKFFVVTTAVASIMGALEGIFDTTDEWKQFFTGLINLSKAVTDIAVNFIKNNVVLNTLYEGIKTLATGIWDIGKFIIVDIPTKFFSLVKEGWKNIFGWLGIGAGQLGKSMDDMAKNLSPDTFKRPDLPTISQMPAMDGNADNTAGGSGIKTLATLPVESQDQESTLDMLGEQLKTVSGSQREQMAKSIEQAMRPDSEGGAAITPEEQARIMANSFVRGLDQSSVLQNIENNTRKSTGGAIPSRRGM